MLQTHSSNSLVAFKLMLIGDEAGVPDMRAPFACWVGARLARQENSGCAG
jgi:hypothetical protein